MFSAPDSHYFHFISMWCENMFKTELTLKGQFTPKSRIHIFLLPVVLLISLDTSCTDFCLLSNIMGLNGALNVVLTKKTLKKLISNVSFQKS